MIKVKSDKGLNRNVEKKKKKEEVIMGISNKGINNNINDKN